MKIPYAPVFYPLLKPSRYKGAHGGRGSGKSQFFASLTVARAVHQNGFRCVCIREVQKSLAQSVKRDIEQKIQEFGVGHLFDVQKSEIKTPGNGLILFQGMQNHTNDSIKSLAGYDVAWVEEAQSLSASSLKMLRPTIRKNGSELWFSWNPRNDDDPVDVLLRGKESPVDACVVEANYSDNPWFMTGTTLNDDRLFDLRRDPNGYRHVWLGEYESKSESRVFKNWKVEKFDTPDDAVFYFGADFGFAVDPTVLVRCFIGKGKDARTLFVDRCIWQVGIEIDRLPTWFKTVPGSQKWQITADNARPELISYLQNHGFPRIKAAIKGPGSVEDGVEFLRSYDIVVHPDAKDPTTGINHVVDELTKYSHVVDKKTDKVTPLLEDKYNHVPDALRYAVEGVRRSNKITHSEFLL